MINILSFSWKPPVTVLTIFMSEKYISDGYYAHFHRNPELYCVFHGHVGVTVNGKKTVLDTGDAVFIDSLQIHSYECEDRAEVAFILMGSRLYAIFQQPLSQPIPTHPAFR